MSNPEGPEYSSLVVHVTSREDVDAIGDKIEAWALDNIRCRDAWTVPPGSAAMGAGIVIGQPDTGFTDHPELGDNALDLTRDWDLLRDDDDAHDPLERRWWFPLDSPGHGTSTASVIVSREQLRVTGAAPRSTLVPLRTVKSVVQVFDGDVAKAVDRAHRTGCHVISMSLGGVGFFNGLQATIRRAVEDGVIVCAAAGNKVGFVVAPARFPECIAVAATNIQDRPWTGSSRGSEVDVAAPGESVWVADVRLNESPPRYDVSRHSGTSFAVTLVAATAALWLARHDRDQLIVRYGRNRIQAAFLHLVRTTGHRRPGGWDGDRYGVGIIDAQALLAAPLPAADAVTDAPAAYAPLVSDPLSKLTGLVPQLSREELADRLSGILGVEQGELDEYLEHFGAELAYLLSEDATVRRRLGASEPADAASEMPALAVELARLASPSLATQIMAADPANPA